MDLDTFSKFDFRAVKVKACEAVEKAKKLLQFTLDDGTGTDRIILSDIHAYCEPEELVKKTLIAILGNSLFRVHCKHHRKDQPLYTGWLALFIVVPIVTCNLLLFLIILHKALKERGLQNKVVETKPLKNFIVISIIIYNSLNSV